MNLWYHKSRVFLISSGYPNCPSLVKEGSYKKNGRSVNPSHRELRHKLSAI